MNPFLPPYSPPLLPCLVILRFGIDLLVLPHYDVHTLDVCTYFGMYGKRRPITILWYQLDVWGVQPVLYRKKSLVRQGLNNVV